jgi:hypothetical protein
MYYVLKLLMAIPFMIVGNLIGLGLSEIIYGDMLYLLLFLF